MKYFLRIMLICSGLFFVHQADASFFQDIILRVAAQMEKQVEISSASSCAYPEDEAFSRSIELLSGGRQGEAEDLILSAVKSYHNDARILLAKAVLERSRWDRDSAHVWFRMLRRVDAKGYLSDVSKLSIALDQHKNIDENMKELIRISDEHPENVYLLWLTAIHCREHSRNDDHIPEGQRVHLAQMGKVQYEKLLVRFHVGPVMLHHTYANILTEVLDDFETALKHRYIAVSLEAKDWTLQGLANTLTDMGRYHEASAIWARTVLVNPDDPEYWRRWGYALRKTDRHEEALEKYVTACKLNPRSARYMILTGHCLKRMERYEEMLEYYHRAAALNYVSAQYDLGLCYRLGLGVETNISEALIWYRKAAEQGNDQAQDALGWCYLKGLGVEQDYVKAAYWYRKAAEQGDEPEAWCNIGRFYCLGQGVEQDFNEAITCYLKALEVDPDNVFTLNNYVWLLVNCSDESLRNYPKAVEMAEQVIELKEGGYSLNSLAVAYEKNGQYDLAVKTQKRLIERWKSMNPEEQNPAEQIENLRKYESLADGFAK